MMKNPVLLGRAATAAFGAESRFHPTLNGYQCQVDGRTVTFGPDGQASVRGATQRWLGQQMDRLKQAYSHEAIREATRRAGFSVRQQGDNVNLLTVERRSA